MKLCPIQWNGSIQWNSLMSFTSRKSVFNNNNSYWQIFSTILGYDLDGFVEMFKRIHDPGWNI